MAGIITIIAISIVIPVAMAAFEFCRRREEKRIRGASDLKIKVTKPLVVFFMCFMALSFAAMIGVGIWAIYDTPMSVHMLVAAEIIIFVFLLISAIGYVFTAFDYVVLKDDGVIVKRPFKKLRKVDYSQIIYFSNSPVAFDGVSCYDRTGVPLFTMSNMHVGIDKLVEVLKQKQIEQLPLRFPLKRFEGYKRFKLYNKLKKHKLSFGLFAGFAVACFFLVFLIYPQLENNGFENTRVDGTISSFEMDEETIGMTLEGDDACYWVNNIVYGELDKSFRNVLRDGLEVTLYIGYSDEYGRENISGIVSGGAEYLDPADAERAEANNYRGGIIACYIFGGVGVVLVILSGVYFYKLAKVRRQMAEAEEEEEEL